MAINQCHTKNQSCVRNTLIISAHFALLASPAPHIAHAKRFSSLLVGYRQIAFARFQMTVWVSANECAFDICHHTEMKAVQMDRETKPYLPVLANEKPANKGTMLEANVRALWFLCVLQLYNLCLQSILYQIVQRPSPAIFYAQYNWVDGRLSVLDIFSLRNARTALHFPLTFTMSTRIISFAISLSQLPPTDTAVAHKLNWQHNAICIRVWSKI